MKHFYIAASSRSHCGNGNILEYIPVAWMAKHALMNIFFAVDLNWQKEKQMINDDFPYGTLFWKIGNADMFDSLWIMD